MFASRSLSNESKPGSSAFMSVTWSDGRLMPMKPPRYRYDAKNQISSRTTGPPTDASGWTSDALDAVPPGTLLPIQLLGEYEYVALPLNVFVPERVTTLAASPMPRGAEASRPL